MADKFLNLTAVQTIKTWAKGLFALDTDLDTLSTRVDNIVSQGGEPNVIETVKVNGTALTPDANKAVNVTVPEDLSDLANTGADPFATESYVDQNGGKIDVIKVNGTAQTITSKEVDIAVPTAVSDLTNDSGFQTANDVSSAINTALTSAMTYKGSVATVADLPSSGNKVGDFYNVTATGENYAWDGSAWDKVGDILDTSTFWSNQPGQSNSLEAATVAEINAILNE